MQIIYSLLAGVLFGAGLTVSDMVNPARVLNFLDVAGNNRGGDPVKEMRGDHKSFSLSVLQPLSRIPRGRLDRR